MLYLYHATYESNLDSILTHGLLQWPDHGNWGGQGDLCLALDAGVAMSYAENSNYYLDAGANDGIILLKVAYDKLNPVYLDWDPRVDAFDIDEIDSCVYNANIPADDLEIVTNPNSEPYQDINSFAGTELYNILMTNYGFEA